MEQPVRSFIAIDLSDGARRQIEAFIRELRKSDAKVGWVRVEGIHLTLKFLGNVAPGLIEEIKPVLAGAALQTAPIHIEPAGCGAFPSMKSPRVIWVGLRGQIGPLAELARQVEAALVPLGFKPEERPFRPHLTIGRVRGRQRLHALQEILLAHQDFTAEPFDAYQVVLYKSELRPDGARYTPLFEAPFSGRPSAEQ
ncbi:MAG TPA: RNA 2',3'-cyclic phosphodiesterase [Syntrophobacteraceae bacterium]|nr:RNA 2',3'-cyclic phosphodiesterase [Syntrophobacteraceae bacterium]